MNYPDFVTRLSTATAIVATNADFVAILPQAIDYAEQRIYRELNLMATSVRNSSYTLTAGNRNLVLPVGTFVVLEKMSVITPAAAMASDAGTRNPLTPVSWDFLDACYNSPTNTGLPLYWAIQDTSNIAFGPWPDQPYKVEIIGVQRPAPLSATNATTTLSLYFPDLFFSAAMIFASGYMRNYGAQSDDPQQGVTWQSQYSALLASAQAEEARKNKMSGL